MTHLAFISDVHADVHALRDALRRIDELGIESVYCCGDLLDYGLFPEETLSLLRERDVQCVRGNHDRWALKPGGDADAWDLSDDAMAFLRSLPTERRLAVNGMRVLVTHARPGNDMQGIFKDASAEELGTIISAAKADVLVVGHTHVPFIRRLDDGRIVMNPGALLRDPGPGCELPTPGTFGEIDVLIRNFSIHQVARGAVDDASMKIMRAHH
jgi:putative phosphoesterase